jgi:hypothetical protein
MPREVHGITDVVIFGTVLAAAVALVLMTRGRLGYETSAADHTSTEPDGSHQRKAER